MMHVRKRTRGRSTTTNIDPVSRRAICHPLNTVNNLSKVLFKEGLLDRGLRGDFTDFQLDHVVGAGKTGRKTAGRLSFLV